MFAVDGFGDPTGLDPAELRARFKELDAQRRRVEAALVAVAGEIEPTKSFRVDGQIFRRFCHAEFLHDWDTTRATDGDQACEALMPRTAAQRRFDALYAIFQRAAAQPPDAELPEPLVNIVVDAHTVDELLNHHPTSSVRPDGWQRHCHTGDGTVVAPTEALGAMWWGRIRTVIVDPAGIPIHLGRTWHTQRPDGTEIH